MEESKENLTSLESRVSVLTELIKGNHETIKLIVTLVDKRFDNVEDKLGKIQTELNTLTKSTETSFTTVGVQLGSIADELSKISATTRYEEEYENLKIVK